MEQRRVFFFMPWCELRSPIVVDDVEFVPLGVDSQPNDVEQDDVDAIRRYLASYRVPDGRTVSDWVVVRRVGAKLIDEYTEDQREMIFDVVEFVKLAALVERGYGGLLVANYVNSDTMLVLGQGIGKEPATTALMTKTSSGHTMNVVLVASLHISMPLHVWGHTRPNVNLALARALAGKRSSTDWMSAIVAFNLANTDSDTVRWQMEWTLLGGVIDRLFSAEIKGDKRDVQAARAFERVVVPRSPWKPYDDVPYRDHNDDVTPRFAWMRELYGLRNEYAHGKRGHDRRATHWTTQEHLFLAKLVFPILMKKLLGDEGSYVLTEGDQELLDLVDHVLLLQSFSSDDAGKHPLAKLRSAKFHDDTLRSMYERLRELRLAGGESDGDDDADDETGGNG